MGKYWTQSELDTLIAEFPTCLDTKKLAKKVNHTYSAIFAKAHALHLKREKRSGSVCYLPNNVEYIKQHYHTQSDGEIAQALGISKAVVGYVAHQYHLVKPDSISHRGRFKNGIPPFNKGMKRSDYMSEEGIKTVEKTQFYKGQAPTKHVEIGHERLNGSKYVVVKVAEPDVFKLKHRVIWEQHNGPVPEGMSICFKDGDRYNFAIENLVMKSHEDIIKENGIVNYPSELRQAIVKLGYIKKLVENGKQKNKSGRAE